MTERIALLGWGSLLWDRRADFDALHGPWLFDGPELRIEFSRISDSRHGVLTLVIDPENGTSSTVAYCLSHRTDLADAIEDLRGREGTTARSIGFLRRAGDARSRDQASLAAIRAWARERELDGVVWTDLSANFQEKLGRPFSVAEAIAHLQSLDPPTRTSALEYINRAPAFVNTPLYNAIAAARFQD
jgi:hypothetical protein